MKRSLVALALLAALCAVPATSHAQSAPTIVMPAQVHWMTSPDLPAGAKIAVLTGDPSKPGPYAVRLMLPDGTTFGPHSHGSAEWVTVLQGTLMVGLGDTMDASKMTALPVGAFAAVPAGVHHYAVAKGDTILELTGMGPMTMEMVH